jgi:hypothetical protein
MSITTGNPMDGIENIDDDSFEEDDVYNFRSLMDQVLSAKDIIFTIQATDLESFKTGLTRRKNRDNAKAKASGIPPDELTLAFLSYPHLDNDKKEVVGQIDVRVKLRPRKGVKILDVRIPSDEI